MQVFSGLPLKERWFVRLRYGSAPLHELAARAAGRDLLDVGCGHGALAALLAGSGAERRVLGIDPDPRKIEWAQRSVGRLPNVRLRCCTIEALDPASERFDTVLISDVLYLLAADVWPALLSKARELLRPGGRLVLKEAEDDGSWRAAKALWQERLMVRLLRRTRSSGAIGFAPRAALESAVRAAGFQIDEVTPFARGYSTPHVLLVAHAQ